MAFNAAAVNQRTNDGGDRQSDDNIRVEEGTPSEIFGVPAACEDPDGKRHHAEDAPDSDSEGSLFGRIFAEQHSLSDGEYDAAGKPEEEAHRDKRPDGVACQPSGDRKAESRADHMIGGGPSPKARSHALKIPSRVRRENSIARDVGQDDDIRQAGRPVQQNAALATQVNGGNHG